MRFKQYIENDEGLKGQQDLTAKIMQRLYYQNGLAPAAIAAMSTSELVGLLQQNQIVDPAVAPIRLAAMVKFAARMNASNDQISPVTPED